jgi:hypothetical protein
MAPPFSDENDEPDRVGEVQHRRELIRRHVVRES